jgi:hypothetical protein
MMLKARQSGVMGHVTLPRGVVLAAVQHKAARLSI